MSIVKTKIHPADAFQGRICSSPCTAIRWVPSSPNLFLVSHADGTIIVYDKEREDGTFTPQEPSSGGTTPFTPSTDNGYMQGNTPGEWNPLDNIFVTMPPWHPVTVGMNGGGKGDKDKVAKNPVSHWRVSRKSIIGTPCLAFSYTHLGLTIFRICFLA